eukprot:CAMPEP_0119325682 /NCGR_PEP_ID=MMETSP1333-20130426/66479_1 /TAXON_ID=418940 /ORGANISM="Scyphosphaera apsteinii, Strain RCC1455" /LENGTH=245 /DNA_ID=CAMNT_0007333745 /DNA_START=57 /DNA_END=790 /DNA_ORIENTATION=-
MAAMVFHVNATFISVKAVIPCARRLTTCPVRSRHNPPCLAELSAMMADFPEEDEAKQRALMMEVSRTAFMFADVDGNGLLEFSEVYAMMRRIATSSGNQEAEVTEMFSRCELDQDGFLTYETFLLQVAECDIESSLAKCLLSFANAVVAQGVLDRLRSGRLDKGVAHLKGSHILDDGSASWRESIEASFDLLDEDSGGTVTREELDKAIIKYPLIKQLLRIPCELDERGQREYMLELYDNIDTDG